MSEKTPFSSDASHLTQSPPADLTLEELGQWAETHQIEDVECIVPDIAGIARGKSITGEKFFDFEKIRLPQSAFMATISGNFFDYEDGRSEIDHDLLLIPDPRAAYAVPWAQSPSLQIIHDPCDGDGNPAQYMPRYVLQRVLDLYKEKGWKPLVAPEIEFYLVRSNQDPKEPLEPPIGRSGRSGAGQAYSISAIDEYEDVVEHLYAYAEAQGFHITSIVQEAGPAQMEINLPHGEALTLADSVFVLKRTIREAALRCGFQATFMAKPMGDQPGSSMHMHQSIIGLERGDNIFTNKDGEASPAFYHFIGGIQSFMGEAFILMAPYVNSYRRLIPNEGAPINLSWGIDNRSTGLRVPASRPEARRVENRLAGVDANPYLAMAATLACGWLGMMEKIEPSPACTGDSYKEVDQAALVADLPSAITLFKKSTRLREILGDAFVDLFVDIKLTEYHDFASIVSSWEREYLMRVV